MDAIYRDHDGVNRVQIVGVLYGGRVQIRFEGSGEVTVPVSMLELEPIAAAPNLPKYDWSSDPRPWSSPASSVGNGCQAFPSVDSLPIAAASLRAWQSLPVGWMSDDMFTVLERLSQAGDPGLLDSQYKPLSRHQVEIARRVLKHKGLVGPADGRPSSEGDGRQVRWRLTKQGVVEYVQARTLVRPVGKGGGRVLATAVGLSV